jgi:hypothetical protein
MQTFANDIQEIPVRNQLILEDIDTPEEYQKAIRQLPHIPLLIKRGTKEEVRRRR